MVTRISGEDLAKQAVTGNYVGIPYSRLDCQGFVEEVLKDCGVRKPDGTPYNWRGSNSMWRNYIKWKGTIQECLDKFGEIPLGAFLFLLKWDGGEQERGYHDGEGNASHVGLYTGTSPLPCMDSQGNRGVDYCKLSVFTHVGLMDMVDYYNEPLPPEELPTREDALKALETLTKYLKEVNI